MERDANENKRDDGARSQSTNAFVLLLTLLAGALLVRQIPLTDSRRPTLEPKAYDFIAPTGVDARLWQDPIGAVAQGIKEAQQAKDYDYTPYRASTFAGIVGKWAWADTKGAAKPIVLGVMVPGGSYRGYAELRRRARFAVIAGLKEMGFTPDDPEHIGYFYLDGTLPKWMGYSAASELTRVPRGQFFPYEWFDRSLPPTSNQFAVPVVPDAGDRQLLLIWLDQDFFWSQPSEQTLGLFDFLLNASAQGPAKARVAVSDAQPPIVVLGPGDSTMLGRMARSKRAGAPKVNVLFYDYASTATDTQLLHGVATSSEGGEVRRLLAGANPLVLRTIGDDEMLACVLRDEIGLRGVSKPDRAAIPQRSPEVILLSELDTDYGRALANTTRDVLVGAKACGLERRPADGDALLEVPLLERHWIRNYTYLRGVDGRAPATQVQSAGVNSGAKASGEADKSSGVAGDNKGIERAEGQTQVDYLRRLAARLQSMDESARSQGEKGIRAVGILGSDVYDKLLALQLLRPALPAAVFFTTDLDARLSHPAELDWTRNLVIASSYGLNLQPGLQPSTPPFRDAYQTSLYLSTLIALTNALQDGCHARIASCPMDQSRIDQWRVQPRLFEIGFRGPVDLTPRPTGVALGDCAGVDQLRECATVHPLSPGLMSERRPGMWRLALVALTIGVVVLLLASGAAERVRFWAHGPPLRSVGLHFPRKVAVGAAGALIGAAVLGIVLVLPSAIDDIGALMTEHGRGVPISFLDGMSIWGTELIRIVALILAVWLTIRGWHKLERNADYVTTEMRWKETRKVLTEAVEADYEKWAWWQKVLHAFSFRLIGRHGDGAPDVSAEPTATSRKARIAPAGERFWREYIYQGRLSARLLRVTLAIVLYFVFATLVAMIFGFPDNPIRGPLTKRFDLVLVLVVVVAMQFLVFFVIDATFLCQQFVLGVSERKKTPYASDVEDFDAIGSATLWPEDTLKHFETKLNVPRNYVDQWITIHVIGLRTKVVSRLIYYPYIIISLAIVARSEVFDNWGMPVTLIIILATSVTIVTLCGILLRRAAEYARRKAAWRLGNELIRLNGSANPRDVRAARQLTLMISQVQRYDTGSFASYLDQPFVRAVLLPLGSVGGVGVLQYLTIWHF